MHVHDDFLLIEVTSHLVQSQAQGARGDRGDGEGTSCLHGSNSANSFLPPTRQRKVEEDDSRRVLQANADLIQSLSAPTALHA
jgi:hypothetical protein